MKPHNQFLVVYILSLVIYFVFGYVFFVFENPEVYKGYYEGFYRDFGLFLGYSFYMLATGMVIMKMKREWEESRK